jgi:hypothetical protein
MIGPVPGCRFSIFQRIMTREYDDNYVWVIRFYSFEILKRKLRISDSVYRVRNNVQILRSPAVAGLDIRIIPAGFNAQPGFLMGLIL